MPLLGNVIFVVGAVGIGLIVWKVLPKIFDKTKGHFEFKEDAALPVLEESEPECLDCACREYMLNDECDSGCMNCEDSEAKN